MIGKHFPSWCYGQHGSRAIGLGVGRGVLTGPWSVGHLYGITEALPVVLGNRGMRAYFSGEQRSKNEGNRGTKAILGNREHRKSRFWFWGTGDKGHLFQGNKGIGTPHRQGFITMRCAWSHTYSCSVHSLCVFDQGIARIHYEYT